MVKQVWGRDTVLGTCGWFTPLPDTPHIDNATVAITNPVDGDGIIVLTITPQDGTAPYDLQLPEPTIDTDTDTDTFTQVVDNSDGTYTVTNVDGSVFNITGDTGVPIADTDTDFINNNYQFDAGTAVITWDVYDNIANAVVGNGSMNLSSLVATAHPSITGTGSVTATFNAATNSWIINGVDTDTDTNTFGDITVATADGNDVNGTAYLAGSNVFVDTDGQVYALGSPSAPQGTDTLTVQSTANSSPTLLQHTSVAGVPVNFKPAVGINLGAVADMAAAEVAAVDLLAGHMAHYNIDDCEMMLFKTGNTFRHVPMSQPTAFRTGFPAVSFNVPNSQNIFSGTYTPHPCTKRCLVTVYGSMRSTVVRQANVADLSWTSYIDATVDGNTLRVVTENVETATLNEPTSGDTISNQMAGMETFMVNGNTPFNYSVDAEMTSVEENGNNLLNSPNRWSWTLVRGRGISVQEFFESP